MNKMSFAGVLVLTVVGLTAFGQPNSPLMQDAHTLVFNNAALQRQVEDVPGGVKTVTTTTDPDLLPVLRRHPRAMFEHYDGGGVVRRWDPLFLELAKVQDQVKYDVRDVENGVEVVSTSDDANVTKLIRAHAAKVTAMLERGPAAMRETSPLPEGYTVSKATTPTFCKVGSGKGSGPRRGTVQNGRGCGYHASGNRNGGFGQGNCQGQGQGMGQMRRGQGQGQGMGQMRRGQGQGQGKAQMRRGQGQGQGKAQMRRGQGQGQGKAQMRRGQGQGQGKGQMRRGQGQGQGMGQMRRGQGQGQMRGACRGNGCGQGTCPAGTQSNG